MTRVKICGIRTVEEARAAAEAGADAVGFVFWPRSRRYVEPEMAARIAQALPPFLVRVGVFVNEPPERVEEIAACVGLDAVQLHGDEPPEVCARLRRRVIKAIRIRDGRSLEAAADYPVSALLLDTYVPETYGGTGRTFDWSLVEAVRHLDRPLLLSGGLNPENVAEAIRRVRPYGVDASSGVETDGRKDPEKICAFVAAVRRADAERGKP
ncbi:MAG: phosphoribosylanthranilate isomerase [Armatimonadota bacterium]|nr:phosphoribosylanthranilate isomerase [Armatimonadota bacterium]MDR7438536.1 phosphoribosylanthranilate isomerase [Armatimonadota bacterium]MDR7562344.1 phosphoribosylanthranilate isomerase [Armatimonadota bacterium]MDR7567576.1 phosphoribosylanthranilate isomerase [Armatimonadota bacterium]MDR7601908.1 phosphoribosylanthranilate isomerase [Armatimonadota bacterium]